MLNLHPATWCGTAELVSVEQDPKKLAALIDQLCREIDQQRHPETAIRDRAYVA